MATLMLLGVFITAAMRWVLKWAFSRPRSFLDTQWIQTYGSAYPNAHSAYAMMLACILFYIRHDYRYRHITALLP